MSAPNPNPGERETDAMHRAQRAHEPSMEEILASIRAIIADDRAAESSKVAPKPAGNAAPKALYPTTDVAPVREVEAAPAKVEPAKAEMAPRPVGAPAPKAVSTRPKAEPSALSHTAEPVAPSVVSAPPEIAPAVLPTPEPGREIVLSPVDEPEGALLSEAADRAVSASFEELTSTLALQSAELIESLTREMLRPMIKTWLDDNLPALVERLVRAEIQRVARGGR
jgi:cell pole-organizing protein PopZ